uniref:Uncharacterized protein n=1 Tax=Plectus sambesii TaxID=2011161 RepID=A0A914VV07_9BILA
MNAFCGQKDGGRGRLAKAPTPPGKESAEEVGCAANAALFPRCAGGEPSDGFRMPRDCRRCGVRLLPFVRCYALVRRVARSERVAGVRPRTHCLSEWLRLVASIKG